MLLYKKLLLMTFGMILLVLKERQEFTPFSELRQIESLLNALEA
jgi:hypothetical protein